MLKILFAFNILVTIVALIFWNSGIKYFKNDECNIKGIKYIIAGTSVTGICIIISAILFSSIFFAR